MLSRPRLALKRESYVFTAEQKIVAFFERFLKEEVEEVEEEGEASSTNS